MAKKWSWVKPGERKATEPDEKRYVLRCRCGNKAFVVAYEQVLAKRHTRSGNRFRTAAHCPICGWSKALRHGNN